MQKTLKREENGSDGQLDFEEFVHYLQDYEKDLKLVVKSLDRKNAGTSLLALLRFCCSLGFIFHFCQKFTERKRYFFFLFSLLVFVSFLGRVDPKEFMQSLQDLGVHISPQHAEKALKR